MSESRFFFIELNQSLRDQSDDIARIFTYKCGI